MGTINQYIIDGNLTKDPILSTLPSGMAKAFYVVAVDEVWYVDGVKRERTDYIPVTTFGRQAENDGKYLKRGAGVTAMGAIRSWHDPATGRDGFNFEADNVKYQAKPNPNRMPASVESAPPIDLWIAAYDNAQSGPRG